MLASIVSILSILALIYCFYYTFAGETARIRFNYGGALLGVAIFSLIPLTFHAIYIRKCLLIQKIVAGNYWAFWQNPDVYITQDGVYYPAPEYKINDFLYGLEKIEIPETTPTEIQFSFLNVRYYSKSSSVKSTKTLNITIPTGKEDEAHTLVQRFQSELGKVSRFVADQWRLSIFMGAGILGVVFLWTIFLAMPLQRAYDKEKAALNDTKRAIYADLKKKETEQLEALLTKIRKVIDPQIEHLTSLPDGQITGKEAGFEESLGVNKIFYGHCQPFNLVYVFVVLQKDVFDPKNLSGPGTFNYTTQTDKNFQRCSPYRYIPALPRQLSNGWYYANLSYLDPIIIKDEMIPPTPNANLKP